MSMTIRTPKNTSKGPHSADTDQRQTLLCAHRMEVRCGASRESRTDGLREEISTAGAVASMPGSVRRGTFNFLHGMPGHRIEK